MIATTDTLPYEIPDMILSGLTGDYIIIGELNCSIINARNYFYVGLYKNGSLISGSYKKFGGLDYVRMPIPFAAMVSLISTDTFSIAVSLESGGSQLNIYERSLTYISI
jgi:hypothetical protein